MINISFIYRFFKLVSILIGISVPTLSSYLSIRFKFTELHADENNIPSIIMTYFDHK